jgi:glycosyltransferase involved in cell wall biosynthesis
VRILLVHNFYGSSSPSGENQVFSLESSLLKSYGHDILHFTRNSDEIREQGVWGLIKGALSTPWNPFSAISLQDAISFFKPDVVHIHNTFPLISPSIYGQISDQAACVLTLHNYRLFCPAGIPIRQGNVCTDCLDRKSVLPSLKHGCYRSSRLATIPLATSVALHRKLKTWSNHVDAYIAFTEFQRELLVKAGLSRELIHVKPNFFPGSAQLIKWEDRSSYVVFAGRLSKEKGVESLINAWLKWGATAPELRILGDGPLRQRLESIALSQPDVPIRFYGKILGKDVEKQISRAKLLVLPSECFEGFPMVVREAFAYGTPVAASNIGPLPDIVKDGKNGLIFEPNSPDSLLEVVKNIWNSDCVLEVLGNKARADFNDKYTESVNYEKLMEIYEKAIYISQNRWKRKSV